MAGSRGHAPHRRRSPRPDRQCGASPDEKDTSLSVFNSDEVDVWVRLTLEGAVAHDDPPDVDLLDLDAALSGLASFDSRKSRMVELRLFGGLSIDDIAHARGTSRATVERDWQVARIWLSRRLNPGPDAHDT